MVEHASQPSDITKILEQFKLPGVDVSALMEARRKDIEALTEVNKIALQSSQTMAQKQVEILQKTMEELAQAMGAGKPLENAAKRSAGLEVVGASRHLELPAQTARRTGL